MRSFQLLALLALPIPALAFPFITSPIGDTAWVADQPQTISWMDPTPQQPPDAQTFGAAQVSIYTGNPTSQTHLQTAPADANIGTSSSFQFTPDSSIGEDGSFYFIRITSRQAPDPNSTATPPTPAMMFSAVFRIQGMKGTFNATVKAQLSGLNAAPPPAQPAPVPPTTPSSPVSSAPASAAPSRAPSSASGRSASSSTTARPSTSSSASGAMSIKTGWVGMILSALLGLTALN